MREELKKVLENSSSLYFNFPVAAILECDDGTKFYGVNVETSSPDAGVCAERNAIFSAISNGYKKESYKALHLMAGSEETIYPCFICRQALVDYCPSDLKIIIYNEEGEVYSSISELCPHSFSEEDLK